MAQLASVLHLFRFSKVLGVRLKGAVDWIVGVRSLLEGLLATWTERQTGRQIN